MKTPVVAFAFAMTFVAAAYCAENTRIQPTPEQKAKIRELRKIPRAERIRRDGGLLYKCGTGNVVRVINAQKLVSLSVIDPMRDGVRTTLGIGTFDVNVTAADAYEAVEKGFAIPKTAAVLAFIDHPKAPRLQVAPEEAWAVVNVRALKADNPSQKLLDTRFLKEAWRGFALALGAADTRFRPCLLARTHSLADLDANPSLVVSPEPFSEIEMNAAALGIDKTYLTTYKRACREGWAPAPTNEVQKAIWDKIHELPTKPIVIEPEKAPAKK